MDITHQSKTWNEEFGTEYLDRNMYNPKELNTLYKERYGLTKDELNDQFLKDIPKDIKILEIGTNIGNQLLHLQSQGYTNLYGIELQDRAIDYAKHRANNLHIIKGDALDVPFKDNYFDLVFTNGVLIHIAPENIKIAMNEMCRVSKKYIWGLEYFADEYTELDYHGQKNLMWKADFCKIFLDSNTNVTVLKEQKYNYLENDTLIDQMYLLQKTK